jgi:hypothetical protein
MNLDAAFALGMVFVQLAVFVGPHALGLDVKKSDHPSVSKRQYFWDNVRFFTEVQVVLSHFCLFGPQTAPTGGVRDFWPRSSLVDSAAADLAWPQILYEQSKVWRMPAFIFLSGLMSKGELNTIRSERLLMVFASYFLCCNFIFQGNWWRLWFLGAIIVWRLSINLLRPLSPPMIAIAGMVITATCPYFFRDSTFFDVEDATEWTEWSDVSDALAHKSALSWYWAFALGYVLDVRAPQLRKIDCAAARIVGACTIIALTLAFSDTRFVTWYDRTFADLYSYCDLSPNRLQVEMVYGHNVLWLPRVFSALLATVCVPLVCAAMPHARTWYSDAGSRNMYAYLLQWPLILPLSELMHAAVPLPDATRVATVVPSREFSANILWFAWLAIASIGTTYMLSTWPVRFVTWPVVEPGYWLKPALKLDFKSTSLTTLAPPDLGINSKHRFCVWAFTETSFVLVCVVSSRLYPNSWKCTVGAFALIVMVINFGQLGWDSDANDDACKGKRSKTINRKVLTKKQ